MEQHDQFAQSCWCRNKVHVRILLHLIKRKNISGTFLMDYCWLWTTLSWHYLVATVHITHRYRRHIFHPERGTMDHSMSETSHRVHKQRWATMLQLCQQCMQQHAKLTARQVTSWVQSLIRQCHCVLKIKFNMQWVIDHINSQTWGFLKTWWNALVKYNFADVLFIMTCFEYQKRP